MSKLRLIFCWYFAFISLAFLKITIDYILSITRKQDMTHLHISLLAGGSISSVLVIIFGAASWTAWRERYPKKEKKRIWTTTASLLSLLISIGIPLLYYYTQGIDAFGYLERFFWLPTAIGVVGIVIFSRSYRKPEIDGHVNRSSS